MNPIKIGHKRELFWDDYLINTSLTGAYLRQHAPREGHETLIVMDRPWEGDGCDYMSIIRDKGIYRMYYMGWHMLNPEMTAHDCLSQVRICCIESSDGIHWERPELDVPYGAYQKTNIVLDAGEKVACTFHAFIDENPACPPDERIKATVVTTNGTGQEHYTLMCYTSADGYHFEEACQITSKGMFDTQNVAFWSETHGKYFCFIRDFHGDPALDLNEKIRDIRVIVSEDFKTWTDPVELDFGGKDDVPLYTNAVFQYPRAPQMMIGMPTRYVERLQWNGNFDQLPDAGMRAKRSAIHPRYGLTTTDCILMTSRDGFRWNRFDEAWLSPGIERPMTWVYGDCYPAVGVIQTKSDLPGAPDELSLYSYDGHWSMKGTYLRRHTIRMDGFLSYRADYAPQKLVTKPLLYEGGRLHLNFATSARGYVYVTARCGKEELHSCELFGDTLDRTVPFDGDLEAFRGKEVTLEFTMSDADLYSMIFE